MKVIFLLSLPDTDIFRLLFMVKKYIFKRCNLGASCTNPECLMHLFQCNLKHKNAKLLSAVSFSKTMALNAGGCDSYAGKLACLQRTQGGKQVLIVMVAAVVVGMLLFTGIGLAYISYRWHVWLSCVSCATKELSWKLLTHHSI